MRMLYLKTDPLLSSPMQQAVYKCETSRLEMKNLRTFLFLAISKVVSGQKLVKLLS